MVYIIEHLEPELYPWCLIEYKHISKLVGKANLWFTNIKEKDVGKLSKYGKVFSQSVKEMKLDNVCILDPEAEKILAPNEKFNLFIFGGILGDDPPRKRTQPELTTFFPHAQVRNLGPAQFSTDNAVYVVSKIVSGKNISDLKFQQDIEIQTGKYDSIILPYKYNLINNKPLISQELVKFLKKKKSF